MKLTIRMNAGQDTVTIDGHTFDRTGLDKGQRHAMAALVRDTLFPRSDDHKPRRPKRGKRRRR
jgi:hypothetical protein